MNPPTASPPFHPNAHSPVPPHFPTPRNASRSQAPPKSQRERSASVVAKSSSDDQQQLAREIGTGRALARPMDASPSSPSSLKHKLRTTVCCCFGGGGGSGPAAAGGERVRWRRRAAVGDFRYDSLSYALNFDEGEDDDDAGAGFRYRNFNSRLPPSPVPAQRHAAVAIA